MSGRTIAIHFVEAALRGARERGLDVWPIMLEAGIPPVLLADPRARVTREQYAQLIRAVWAALDDEFMGLGDFACKRGTFAMMCLVVLGCQDLETSLRRAADFYALFPTTLRFRPTTSDGVARLSIELGTVPDPDRFVTECLVTIWHRVIGWAIDRRVPLAGVEFGYPAPPHVAEYAQIFGCPMSFGHTVTSLTVDAAYLKAPIVQNEARLWARMASAPDDLLAPPVPETSHRDRVRRILSYGHASQNEVAARLAVSPQTLRRHLHAEGTSYRALKEELLRDAAIVALAGGEQSVEEIAARLGFGDASAFHRAFKRWTGTTPGAYRGIDGLSNR